MNPVLSDITLYACGKYFPHVFFKNHMWKLNYFRSRTMKFVNKEIYIFYMCILFSACGIQITHAKY